MATTGQFERGWNDARCGRTFDPPPLENHGWPDYEAGYKSGREPLPEPRLIAAAPELLAALEAIARKGTTSFPTVSAAFHNDSINIARAAIAKAKGETS